MRIERFQAIVIGAGSAGLAAGYYLAQLGIDFVMLSDEARLGDNWRRRWDSLRLFTPARYSALPGMPFPAAPGHLADKDEVARYQEQYAARFDLPVRLRTRVQSLSHCGKRFVVDIGDSRLEAENVIVATGAFRTPRIPSFADRISPAVRQLHSSQYRSPFDLPEGPTLVVGAGNSGAQIALELARHRKVWLAGRNTGHLPRRMLGRDVFDWIWPVLSRANTSKGRDSGDALIGIPERVLSRAGVTRVGRLTDIRGEQPVCDDVALDPRTIVWCTGFVPDYRWIDLPIFGQDGAPRHERGVASGVEGLYFLGLRYQHRVTSSLLGGVGADAKWVTQHLAVRADAGGH